VGPAANRCKNVHAGDQMSEDFDKSDANIFVEARVKGYSDLETCEKHVVEARISSADYLAKSMSIHHKIEHAVANEIWSVTITDWIIHDCVYHLDGHDGPGFAWTTTTSDSISCEKNKQQGRDCNRYCTALVDEEDGICDIYTTVNHGSASRSLYVSEVMEEVVKSIEAAGLPVSVSYSDHHLHIDCR